MNPIDRQLLASEGRLSAPYSVDQKISHNELARLESLHRTYQPRDCQRRQEDLVPIDSQDGLVEDRESSFQEWSIRGRRTREDARAGPILGT